jgi:hypothetical protein
MMNSMRTKPTPLTGKRNESSTVSMALHTRYTGVLGV